MTICVGVLALLGGIASGPVFAQAGKSLRVEWTDALGEKQTGTWGELSAGMLKLEGADSEMVPLTELWEVRFPNQMTSEHVGVPVPSVYLANGDRLTAEPLRMDEEFLTVAWREFPDRSPIKIPLETVAGIVWDLPSGLWRQLPVLERVLNRKIAQDVLVLKNGDRIRGDLLGFNGETVRMDGAVGATRIERSGIRSLLFNPELSSFPSMEGLRCIVSLRDGSRVTVRELNYEVQTGMLRCEALFGADLELPLEQVVRMQFFGGRTLAVSDLEPAEFEFTPYLSTRWEYRRNLNVLGGPLRLGGREYAKGIGVQSRTELTYDLSGEYRQFRATIGLDDLAGPKGNVVFAVDVDGDRRFTSDPVSASDEPLPIPPVDLKGARTLTLIVDFGQFGDIQDFANWADAILIR